MRAFSWLLIAALQLGIYAAYAVADEASPTNAPPAQPTPMMTPPPKVIPPPRVPPGVEYQPGIETGTGGGRKLHVDAAWPNPLPNKPMPAILFVHGGAWTGGSYKIMVPMNLATHGYFVASVEYRLTGEAKWPAQLEDCKLAVRWLRANAEKYHVDPNRIGVWGESAGGHLVACLGTIGPEAGLEGQGGYPDVSSKVQAVVDYFGPVDFVDPTAGYQKNSNLPRLFGSTLAERPDLWKQASPILYVQKGDPPFLIMHGDHDHSVPFVQSERFLAALQKADVPAELVTVQNVGHGFAPIPGLPAETPTRQELNARLLAFFDKNLKGATP